MSDFVCPSCDGKREMFAFWDGPGVSGHGMIECSTCKGSGWITAEHSARMSRGRELREARVGRAESLRECARRLGMSASRLSRIERGDEEPPPDFGQSQRPVSTDLNAREEP